MTLLKKLGIIATVTALAGAGGYVAQKGLDRANELNAQRYGISEPKSVPINYLLPLAVAGIAGYKMLNQEKGKRED